MVLESPFVPSPARENPGVCASGMPRLVGGGFEGYPQGLITDPRERNPLVPNASGYGIMAVTEP